MKDRDAELREELETHLKMATADRVARGAGRRATPPRRRAARWATSRKSSEATRDVWRPPLARAGARRTSAMRCARFRRNPGFALVAILSLTLGIGANTALFEVVNAVRLRTLPVADPAASSRCASPTATARAATSRPGSPSVTQPIWREIAARPRAVLRAVRLGTGRVQPDERRRGAHRRGPLVSAANSSARSASRRPPAASCRSTTIGRAAPPRAVLGHGMWQRRLRR